MKSLILSGIATISAIHAFTQNVSFDSTFGTNARTFTQNGNPDLNSADYKFASYQPGGSFFLAGSYGQTDTIYFVTKFKSNGAIDSSWSINGKLFVKKADFGISTVISAGFDSSFRFFFVGKEPSPSGNPYYRQLVVRYTTNGSSLDPTFGTNGVTHIPYDDLTIGGTLNFPVASYKNNKLLICGYFYEGIVDSYGLIRLQENGSLDNSFGAGGKLFLPHYSSSIMYSLNIQADGKILFARTFNGNLTLFRQNDDGSDDLSFNQTGSITIDYPVSFQASQGITLLANGKIFLCAGSISGYYLYRYTTDGRRDSSFGGIGYVPYNFGYKTYARDFEEQPDGKIISAGVIQDNRQPIPNINTLLTRTELNGNIDSSFDSDGIWFFYRGGIPSSGMKQISLLADGKLLFSGLETDSTGREQFVTYRLKEIYTPQASLAVVWNNASSIVLNYDCSSQVQLDWSTQSETNIQYFKIGYSTDNNQFDDIAQIPASGNSATQKNYQFIFTSPEPGIGYYKINAVAVDGDEFVYGVLTTVITINAPLLKWKDHELIARASDACLPAIKLHFDSEEQLISDSIIIDFSTDSLNFVTIGNIFVPNPQQQITNYEYTHNSPVPGKNFYRLRIKDPSGFCSSSIHSVKIEDQKELRIFPNPVYDKLFFSQSLSAGSMLTIFDMKGSLIMKKVFSASVSEFDISRLPAAQYVITVYTSCSTKTVVLTKLTK